MRGRSGRETDRRSSPGPEGTEGRPPALARRLLARVLPPEDRDALLRDLDQEFREHRVPAEGARAARRWYRSQVVRSLPHGFALRVEAVVGRVAAGAMEDLRFAVRTLRTRPGFTASVVAPLGVGIGVCVLAWGVVDGVILNPFPYPEPDRLVAVVVEDRRREGSVDFMENVSPPEFLDVRRQSRTLESFYAFDWSTGELETPGGVVSASFTLGWGDPFELLGVHPWLGRGFRPEEMEPVGAPVMVLSHRLWVRAFGADSSVVGRRVELSRGPRTVVGVMPPGVIFADADVWRPGGSPPARRARGPRRLFQIAARIRPGHDLDDVNRELAEISRRMEARHGAEHPEYRHRTLRAVTWTAANVREYRPLGYLLFGATVLLLLLISVNAANLILARSVRRGRELAVRVALGAGRLRLARQILCEGVLLALLAGALGAAVAALGLQRAGELVGLMPGVHGRVTAGWRLLPWALLVSVGVGVLVSLLPALHVTRRDVRSFLRTEGPGSTASPSLLRKQHLLIGVEAALTVVVLAAGTVLIRSFVEVARADPGFETSNLLTLQLDLPGRRYGPEEGRAFWRELERRVAELPGVRSAGVTTGVHGVGVWRRAVSLDGEESLEEMRVVYASPAYLEALGIRVVEGVWEEFAGAGGPGASALVNPAFVQRYDRGRGVLGRTVRDVQEELGREYRIVGVAENLSNAGLLTAPEPEVILNRHHAATYKNAMHLVVRTEGPPLEVVPDVRALVRRMDPGLPLRDVATVEGLMARESAPLRLGTWTLVILSVTALLLAGAGVAGVVAFAAAQHRREIGLRRALGARGGVLRRTMMRQTLRPALVGLGVGAVAVLVAGDAAASLLPPPAKAEPVLALLALLPVAVVAAVAAWVPARRASRVDPVEVLRAE